MPTGKIIFNDLGLIFFPKKEKTSTKLLMKKLKYLNVHSNPTLIKILIHKRTLFLDILFSLYIVFVESLNLSILHKHFLLALYTNISSKRFFKKLYFLDVLILK